ncbi:MAG: hypothetical protein M3R17_11525 [Bacteroidota bacterium]|nr:hypothetical protein [Bacteroidota bacterium]
MKEYNFPKRDASFITRVANFVTYNDHLNDLELVQDLIQLEGISNKEAIHILIMYKRFIASIAKN